MRVRERHSRLAGVNCSKEKSAVKRLSLILTSEIKATSFKSFFRIRDLSHDLYDSAIIKNIKINMVRDWGGMT